jgi:hypothetical protein
MRHIIYILFLIISLDSCSQTEICHHYLIANINIVDIKTGKIIPHQWIGIDSNRITKIYNRKVVFSDSTIVIDGSSKYLIPGLWDMYAHYHWNYIQTTPIWIANGVVGLRDTWGDMSNIKHIRAKIKEGTLISPELFSSGNIINGRFEYIPTADLVEDSVTAIKIVNEQKAEGVDFLKILSHLNRESYFAIMKQAKRVSLDVTGLLPESVSLFEAIQAGQKCIAHNLGILEATANGTDTSYTYFNNLKGKVPNWRIDMYDYLINNHNEILMDSLIIQLANSDTWLCPTMVALEGVAYQYNGLFRNDYRNRYVPNDMVEQWESMSANSDTAWIYALRRKYEFNKSLLKKMIHGGVKFLAGADYPCIHVYPGFSIHDELNIFVEAGFSTLQALQTATLNPAIYFNKLDDYGVIEEGKVASFLILSSNPLDDIKNTRNIEVVFLKGNYFSKDELDKLLKIE